MMYLVLAVLAVIAGSALAVTGNMIPAAVLFAAAPVLIAISAVTTVKAGHTGIITTFGKVSDKTLDSGFHLKAPWQNTVQMNNRVQRSTVSLECFSSDIQKVSALYTVNYRIDKSNAQRLYKTVGESYYDTVISPEISESVKTVIAKYTAESLIGSRNVLSAEMEELLSSKLSPYNIELVSSALEHLDFTDEFTSAVEKKQVAVQNKLRAQTEQEQKTMEAQQAAERAQIDANAAAEVAKIGALADLEVTKIQADAAEYAGQKEAAKNKAIAGCLTEDLIQYYYIQQWNGKLPETYLGSDNVSTIIGLSEKAAAKAAEN